MALTISFDFTVPLRNCGTMGELGETVPNSENSSRMEECYVHVHHNSTRSAGRLSSVCQPKQTKSVQTDSPSILLTGLIPT